MKANDASGISSAQGFAGEIVWRPTAEWIERSNLRRFMDAHGIPSLDELQRRSTSDIAWFWDAVLRDLGIQFHEPYSEVVDLSRGIAWPRWCVSGGMNIVHNCLDRYAGAASAISPSPSVGGYRATNLLQTPHRGLTPCAARRIV